MSKFQDSCGRWRRLLLAPLLLYVNGWLLAPSCREQPAGTASAGEAAGAIASPAESAGKRDVFPPQVAGGFYSADADELRKGIEKMLGQAAGAEKKVSGDILGILAPHAGYPYSGPVAAHAFRAVQGRGFKRVVVLGPAHRRGYPVPALLDADAYQTPLGDIPIDRQGVRKLAESGAARVDRDKFLDEHALEVELPFLQVALGKFELVPVMISFPQPERMKKLAEKIRDAFPGPDTLVVASTDMSHDYPYDVAVAMDENALRYVVALDTEGLWKAYQAFHQAGAKIKVDGQGKPQPDCAQFCGMGPVLTLMELAKLLGPAKATVLDRRNSGDIVGDRNSRIVGYSAVAFHLEQARKGEEMKEKKNEAHAGSTGDFLSPAEKKELLSIARGALEAYLKDRTKKDFSPASKKLKEPGAAFVTLKKHGELRGCIGHMEPTDPLWQMIRDRAIDAAVHDSRFPQVRAEELKDISIEISVLSPRVEAKDPLKDIVIGRDGVWLELGYRRGVFLPQVPVEQGWETVEEYLDHLCQKAGVYQAGCWKSPEARIMRFSALVFGEEP